MAERRHRERILPSSRGEEMLGDARFYLGAGETRGLARISPQLPGFVTEESMVLKEPWVQKTSTETMSSCSVIHTQE